MAKTDPTDEQRSPGTVGPGTPPVPEFDGLRSQTICIGERRTIGLRVKGRGSEYFVGRTSLMPSRDATFYPTTPEGWLAAWRNFAAEDASAAEVLSAELRRLERKKKRDDAGVRVRAAQEKSAYEARHR